MGIGLISVKQSLRIQDSPPILTALLTSGLFSMLVASQSLPGSLRPFAFGLTALFTLIVIWRNLEAAIYLLIWSAFFMDWMSDDEALNLVPHYFNYISDVILLILVAKVSLIKLRTRDFIRADFFFVMLLIVFLGILAAAWNGLDPYSIALGLRKSFKWILFFFILLNLPLNEVFFRHAIGFLLFMVLIQVPIAVFQYVILGEIDDQVYGSVRSTGFTMVLAIIGICIFTGFLLHYKIQNKWVPLSVLAAWSLMILPVIGEVRAFFFYFPLVLTFLLLRAILHQPLRTSTVGGLMLAGFVVAAVLFGRIEGNVPITPQMYLPAFWLSLTKPIIPAAELRVPVVEVPEPKSEEAVVVQPAAKPEQKFSTTKSSAEEYRHLNAKRDMLDANTKSLSARTANISIAHHEISNNNFTLLFGYGFGSKTLTYVDVIERRAHEYFLHAPIASLLYEIGYIGLFLYVSIFIIVYRAALKVMKIASDPFWCAVSFSFSAFPLLYALSFFYTDILVNPVALPFWFLAASIYKMKDLIKGSQIA